MKKEEKVVPMDLQQMNRNELEEEFMKMSTTVEELEAKVKWYEAQMRLSKQKQFGASSEKTDANQLGMFDEAETTVDENEPEPELEKTGYGYRACKIRLFMPQL